MGEVGMALFGALVVAWLGGRAFGRFGFQWGRSLALGAEIALRTIAGLILVATGVGFLLLGGVVAVTLGVVLMVAAVASLFMNGILVWAWIKCRDGPEGPGRSAS